MDNGYCANCSCSYANGGFQGHAKSRSVQYDYHLVSAFNDALWFSLESYRETNDTPL